VIILERSTTSQRGQMSRSALELKPGVFVADYNARVRDKIWEKVCTKWKSDAIMLFSTAREQSYGIRINGHPDRAVEDFDGISLMSVPHKVK